MAYSDKSPDPEKGGGRKRPGDSALPNGLKELLESLKEKGATAIPLPMGEDGKPDFSSIAKALSKGLVEKFLGDPKEKLKAPKAIKQTVGFMPHDAIRGESWKNIRKKIVAIGKEKPLKFPGEKKDTETKDLAHFESDEEIGRHTFVLPNNTRLTVVHTETDEKGTNFLCFNFSPLSQLELSKAKCHKQCHCESSFHMRCGVALFNLIGPDWEQLEQGHPDFDFDSFEETECNKKVLLVRFFDTVIEQM